MRLSLLVGAQSNWFLVGVYNCPKHNSSHLNAGEKVNCVYDSLCVCEIESFWAHGSICQTKVMFSELSDSLPPPPRPPSRHRQSQHTLLLLALSSDRLSPLPPPPKKRSCFLWTGIVIPLKQLIFFHFCWFLSPVCYELRNSTHPEGTESLKQSLSSISSC